VGNYSQTKECDHEYCKKCVKRYVEAEVNSKMYKEEINCPAGSKCNSKMKYYDIKLLATKKGF
jgi:hypothetical protein